MKIPDGWKQRVSKKGIIEWVCPHNVGHPAPKMYQPNGITMPEHECDGCCAQLEKYQLPEGQASFGARPI